MLEYFQNCKDKVKIWNEQSKKEKNKTNSGKIGTKSVWRIFLYWSDIVSRFYLQRIFLVLNSFIPENIFGKKKKKTLTTNLDLSKEF